ncbi:TetR family transcriptional regulator [Streptomyces gardneri]|nr:TetR family transcriptional regulator [Streptomyces gardneri]
MARQSLRDRQRSAARDEIQRVALALFVERGFDAVSISDIAAEVGVAHRTFYRHFPSKEDVVLNVLDDFAPAIHTSLRRHPSGQPPWKVLHGAFEEATRTGPAVGVAIVRMIHETPRLRAVYSERQRQWEAMVAEVLAERMNVDPDIDPRPGLWATMAFDILTRTTLENAMRNSSYEPLRNLEQRFRQAEEFFSGILA